MAELTIGDHCSLEECHLLDFLPLECDMCHSIFCKEHIFYANHKCKNFPFYSSSSVDQGQGTSNLLSYDCYLDKCLRKELVQVKCLYCDRSFCLLHRHPQDHKCLKMPANCQDKKIKTRELVKTLASNRNESSKISTKPLTDKAKQTAAKIALMKIKQKAIGDTGLPTSERVYLEIKFFNEDVAKSHYFFFDNRWSVGKCVDQLAKMLKIEYQIRHQKLHLFIDSDTGDLVELTSGRKLCEFVSDGIVSDGGTLILKYS